MSLKRSWMMCAALATLTGASTGCMTAVKQTVHGVRGAQGKFYEVKVVNPETLAAYKRVEVRPFTNELGDRVPQAVIKEVNERVPKFVAKSELFPGGDKSLRVTGKIIHFTGKSGLKGSVGSVIGGGEECVCRVELVDGGSDEVVGEAVCWGVVKSAVRRGSGQLGEGVGKAVVEWLEERMPKSAKKARKEEAE